MFSDVTKQSLIFRQRREKARAKLSDESTDFQVFIPAWTQGYSDHLHCVYVSFLTVCMCALQHN